MKDRIVSILLFRIFLAVLLSYGVFMAEQIKFPLEITSPVNGTVVSPGQDLTVEVSSLAHLTFK
jgi:hypothetical protein